MNNKIIINQSSGLGDIFFTQKIAETLLYNGYDVYWPVKSSISWIDDYLINTRKVFYFDEKDPIYLDNLITITLDGAHNLTGGLIMPSKYQILDIDWLDWLDYFNFKRNTKKENELYYDVLNLKDNENYTFINKHYGTPPEYKTYDIKEDLNEKNINLEILEEFTIFDWIKVIENASKISIIDTCLNYIIEKINIKTDDLTCFCRNGKSTYNQILPLFKKNWKYKWN